ncbi:DoxX family protein [Streptomyces sp. NPDC087420]|uniref:DoxX family protein n=1 Tax=Streptomyces sp. NPDC087420 TaxID=3365785 RepID=UPI00383316D0
MTLAFVLLVLVTVSANVFSAVCDFVRYEKVAVGMDAAGVPRSWMPALGVPKAAAALGLVAAFWIPPLGTAAAAGLVVFYLCAVATHLRVRDYSFGFQYPFLVLAVATLLLSLAR